MHQQVSIRFDYAFIFIYILGNIRCGSSGKEKTVFSICLFSHLSLSLRTVPAPMSLLGETGGWGTTYLLERRLLDALILTNRNFATFKSCHRQSNGRCSRGVYITPLVLPVSSREVLVYTYRRGLLRCSF